MVYLLTSTMQINHSWLVNESGIPQKKSIRTRPLQPSSIEWRRKSSTKVGVANSTKKTGFVNRFDLPFGATETTKFHLKNDDLEQESLKILGILKKWKMRILDKDQLILQNYQNYPIARVALKPQEESKRTQCFPGVFFWWSFVFLQVQTGKKDLPIYYFYISVMFSHCGRGMVNINCWSDLIKTDFLFDMNASIG